MQLTMPQRFAMPLVPQASPAGHPPQSILPPQPSPTTPQYLPFAGEQLVCAHAPESAAAPHTFGVPPPAHERGEVQLPQSRRRPQPSPMRPQYVPPTCAQVSGAHPSTGMLQTFCTHS
jgi:hypothetical protein